MRPTFSGHNLFDVASAFQKSVRRGLEEEALHWAVEMDRGAYGEYVWKRIRIIVSEDIGLANPPLATCIASLYRTWKNCEDESRRPVLLQAVRTVVRSQKSRLVDHALMVWYHYADTSPATADDDQLLKKFQSSIAKRDERKALFQAACLDRRDLAKKAWVAIRICAASRVYDKHYLAPIVHALEELWKDQNKKNDAKHAPQRLFLMHAVLLLARGDDRISQEKGLREYYGRAFQRREIPDFAYDKHSLKGYGMGRGVRHFFEEGAKLKNDRCFVDPYKEEALKIMEAKEAADKAAKEEKSAARRRSKAGGPQSRQGALF
ncbi:MAG: hypothetical protein RIF32_21880 [Leptospirales bacterium]